MGLLVKAGRDLAAGLGVEGRQAFVLTVGEGRDDDEDSDPDGDDGGGSDPCSP